MIPTAPLRLRNRLAETILLALADPTARRDLARLGSISIIEGLGSSPERDSPRSLKGSARRPSTPHLALPRTANFAWLEGVALEHVALVRARARRASEALAACPLLTAEPSLDDTLGAAAALFDAGLHFEVHELLEPSWARAEGAERQALQGLIQIAVGYQHLANGNLAGARALLDEGTGRLRGGRLTELDLAAFADAVSAAASRLADRGAVTIPSFPRRSPRRGTKWISS